MCTMRLLPVCGCLYTLLWTTHTVSAFTWDNSMADGTKLEACDGERVSIPWDVRLDDGEGIATHDHYHKLDNNASAKEHKDGVKINVVTKDPQITFGPGYHLHISGVGVQDSGQYTLTVQVTKDGQTQTYRNRVFLHVKAGPVVDGEFLQANLLPRVVLRTDKPQSEFQVKLACGTFRNRGNPPVSVVWNTPSGSTIPSTSYNDGVFYLILDNTMVSEGYSCQIDQVAPALACVQPQSKLFLKATVQVDQAQKAHVDSLAGMTMCPVGWYHVDKKCYILQNIRINFDAAKSECNRLGGKLAEPMNIRENGVLKAMLQEHHPEEYYLGARRAYRSASSVPVGHYTTTSVFLGLA